MIDASRFDLASLPVRDILARHPQLGPRLAAHGLDACCGGMHPLRDACAARGKDLDEVVRDLEAARTGTEGSELVPPTLSIRELLRRFPATRPVLERYGLGDCGGEDGPDEPLAWFATVHRLPLEDFSVTSGRRARLLAGPRGEPRAGARGQALFPALRRRVPRPDAHARSHHGNDRPDPHRDGGDDPWTIAGSTDTRRSSASPRSS